VIQDDIQDVQVRQVNAPEEIGALRAMLREYLTWAFTIDSGSDVAPTFQGLDEELAELPGIFAPPTGSLIVALVDGELAGCVALRQVDERTGELKRMYVRPAFRGRQLGQRLVGALIDQARAYGYHRVILDSHVTMTAAHRIYEAAGFRFVDPPDGFPEALLPVVVFMELDLIQPA
jgi:GNAT superfamily N-acetyltransferase